VGSPADAFAEIRAEVERAASRPELTELYNRAGYLIAIAYDSFWERKFSDDIVDIRYMADEEFGRTARKINNRAERLGLEGNYDEVWA
jgi:hypothetical protein